MKTVDFLRALADESVEFVLVGGMAVQLHGYLRRLDIAALEKIKRKEDPNE